MTKRRILLVGAGGGLDIINCLPYYCIFKEHGHDVLLASIRPVRQKHILPLKNNGSYQQITAVDINSIFQKEDGKRIKGRYVENKLAGILNQFVYIFSRPDNNGKYDSANLAKELDDFIANGAIDECIFVDGGGDSLILTPEDAIKESQEVNPFKGGDAFALEVIHNMKTKVDLLWYVVACGLDINFNRFCHNLSMLKNLGIYFGTFDLNSPEEPESNWVATYKGLAEQILKLDKNQEDNTPSKTATVLYHAICGNLGLKHTFVDWDKTGIVVEERHSETFVFNPRSIHSLKLKLNEENS